MSKCKIPHFKEILRFEFRAYLQKFFSNQNILTLKKSPVYCSCREIYMFLKKFKKAVSSTLVYSVFIYMKT